MKLMTKALAREFAKRGPQSGDDAVVVAKFFDPYGFWTWYATEATAVFCIQFNLDEPEYHEVNYSERAAFIEAHPYATEVDTRFFGFVDGTFPELGYFSLADLSSLRKFGQPRIERDMYWTPVTLAEVQAKALTEPQEWRRGAAPNTEAHTS